MPPPTSATGSLPTKPYPETAAIAETASNGLISRAESLELVSRLG
jgi:hypothetical protein